MGLTSCQGIVLMLNRNPWAFSSTSSIFVSTQLPDLVGSKELSDVMLLKWWWSPLSGSTVQARSALSWFSVQYSPKGPEQNCLLRRVNPVPLSPGLYNPFPPSWHASPLLRCHVTQFRFWILSSMYPTSNLWSLHAYYSKCSKMDPVPASSASSTNQDSTLLNWNWPQVGVRIKQADSLL